MTKATSAIEIIVVIENIREITIKTDKDNIVLLLFLLMLIILI